MPYKHRDKQRHKFTKAKYRVTNWPEYNEALRQRGDITLWFSNGAIANWIEPAETYSGRGRPKTYSDIAIQTALFLRQVYSLPLRQTQGLLRSLARLMELAIPIMDFSTLSKRSDHLAMMKLVDQVQAGSHVIVDSSGLKVYGKGEWQQEKYQVLAKRTWRKLHIAIDEKHQIIACELTDNTEGDPTVVPELLSQLDTFEKFIADGAYDGMPTYDAVLSKQAEAHVVIPPAKNAVEHDGNDPRNAHINMINEHGRTNWQKSTEYVLRALVELAIQRYKRIIGDTLRARNFRRQKTEAQVSVRALNKMTQLGMPISVKMS